MAITMYPLQSFPHTRMAIFSKVDCHDPSQLFWFINQVTFGPYHFKINLSNRIIVDNTGISQQEFASLWLTASVFNIQERAAPFFFKVYYPASFCR